MRIFIWLFIVIVLLISCIELYDFKIKNEQPALVIEGQISTISFNEMKGDSADGRYFTVKLRLTSDVDNVRDKMVANALVSLHSSEGQRWDYTESVDIQGEYILCDDDFKAEIGVRYKLEVTLSEGEIYESDWEEVPENVPEGIGDVEFEELEKDKYVYVTGEKVLKTIKGIDVKIGLPANESKQTTYYKWDFKPTWEYKSPLISTTRSDYRCWIADPYYLSFYVLHTDNVGLYSKKLFFLETRQNDRILGRFSVLISQYALSEDYYTYWKDIQEQENRGGLFDVPPYNLRTNFKAKGSTNRVNGYFGVVKERVKRWYFSKSDLSYTITYTWKDDCTGMRLRQPPRCYSCLDYENGDPTNIKPDWWEE